MIKTRAKTETVRKQIMLYDSLVERIDEEALADYPTRPEFMAEAIRALTDKLMNQRGIEYATRASECTDPLKIDDFLFERMRSSLQEMKYALMKYETDEVTPVTTSLTNNQLKDIGYFVRMDGPIRNMQEYCRIAVMKHLDERMMARDIRNTLMP